MFNMTTALPKNTKIITNKRILKNKEDIKGLIVLQTLNGGIMDKSRKKELILMIQIMSLKVKLIPLTTQIIPKIESHPSGKQLRVPTRPL